MSNATTAASESSESEVLAAGLPAEVDSRRAWAQALVERARSEGVALTGEEGRSRCRRLHRDQRSWCCASRGFRIPWHRCIWMAWSAMATPEYRWWIGEHGHRCNISRPRCQCTCMAKVAHRTVERCKEDDASGAAAVFRGARVPTRAKACVRGGVGVRDRRNGHRCRVIAEHIKCRNLNRSRRRRYRTRRVRTRV
jgi:hypothetical protein